MLDPRTRSIAVPESNLKDAHNSAVPSVRRGRLRWIGFTTFIVRAYKDIVTNFILTI
jgi:hypothetical protein